MEQNDRYDQYRYAPLSPWTYWGLSLLYAIPVIGFIFLIVFSFDKSNINRRNFTRSYWCWLIVVVVVVLILAATGILNNILYNLR